MKVDLFTDRFGDTLSCVSRRTSNPIPDPIITITKGRDSSSVVFVEDEAREFLAKMAEVLLGEKWGPL